MPDIVAHPQALVPLQLAQGYRRKIVELALQVTEITCLLVTGGLPSQDSSCGSQDIQDRGKRHLS